VLTEATARSNGHGALCGVRLLWDVGGSGGVWGHPARRFQGVFFKRPVLSPVRRRLGSGDVRVQDHVG
jgi:hypothetical protein